MFQVSHMAGVVQDMCRKNHVRVVLDIGAGLVSLLLVVC